MGARPTIIVAGYGSWAEADVNPASQILVELEKTSWPECHLVCLEIPVESATLLQRLDEYFVKYAPDAWIGLGVNSTGATINPELVGINWRHFMTPDISGATAHMLPIIQGGPVAYGSDLPNQAIVERLCAAQIPAALSFHAGTHCCNQMLYSVRHIVETRGLKTLSGFIHVPQTPANIARRRHPKQMGSSMSLEVMSRAIAMAVELVATRLSTAVGTAD